MACKHRGTTGTGSPAKTCNDHKRIDIMSSAGVYRVNDAINFIRSDSGPGYIVSADTMTLNHRLPDKDAIFHLDVFEAHQVSPCGIDSNTPETVGAELLVLFNEHVDNFAPCLTKANEKDPHLVTPSNGLTI
jgi:hypothetical protein